MTAHPLYPVLIEAAGGRFPPVDGAFEVLPPDPFGAWAIVEFTGHSYVLGELDPSELKAVGADGFGGAGHPNVQRLVAGPKGWIGSHDAVLVRRLGSHNEQPLPVRTDLDHHPRVRRAREHRREVTVFGDETGLVVMGRGLVDRTEIAVELLAPAPDGTGRRLIDAAMGSVAGDGWCFAQVAPGNAASLRSFLAAGFKPIASEILIHPTGDYAR